MKRLYILFIILIVISSCKNKAVNQEANSVLSEAEPILRENGKWIEFPSNSHQVKIFTTTRVEQKQYPLSLSAPATVVGRVQKSSRKTENSLILFNSPDITGIYSTYMQSQALVKTATINFNRVNDLYKNGAATGKDLNDASAELTTIQTSMAENEARLHEEGLNPESLSSASVGTVWLICDLPESELNLVKKGQKYTLSFPSFPNETFTANIDIVADVMNTQTRKIKIRLSLIDKEVRIRPGMYAVVKFESPHSGLMVPKKAVISANASYYVFVKKSETTFERRAVTLSSEAGDFIELASGVNEGEEVVSSNVYLLKGINLGI
jgi:multidrug efflux pump subunit AcrA (membrane-fusion protein)